jgi:hypothetical protein
MNLNSIAEADLAFTLEDVDNGFGVELFFHDLDEGEQPVNCMTTDISYFVDPQTGEGISSRQVEITCRISTIESKQIPIRKGLFVKHYDTAGNEYKSCIKKSNYDRKLGVITILLEGKQIAC